MDELEFRRQLMADPNSKDPELQAYIDAHPQRKELVDELRRFDADIESALKVDVPENLAERIILNQSMHQAPRRRLRFDRLHLALAASVALTFGALVYNQLQPPLTQGEHALAHVYHEIKSLESSDSISLAEVNNQLAKFNGHLDALPGKVNYVTVCNFKGQKGVHLVFSGESGPVTLFIVPGHNRYTDSENFYDQRFAGLVDHQPQGDVILVASHHTPLEKYHQDVDNALRWL